MSDRIKNAIRASIKADAPFIDKIELNPNNGLSRPPIEAQQKAKPKTDKK